MSNVAKALQSRFLRRQDALFQERRTTLANDVRNLGKPGPARAQVEAKVPELLQKGSAELYEKFAKGRDAEDLRALTGEIESRFRKGAAGLLIRRITRMNPDSAGNFAPTYLGLQVVGEGTSLEDALIDYESRKARYAEGDNSSAASGICTAQNPTGEPMKAQAILKAAPEGFNAGYASKLAAAIVESMEGNPSNVGRIELFGKASPLQPKAYLKDDLFFLSKEEWLKRDGICRWIP